MKENTMEKLLKVADGMFTVACIFIVLAMLLAMFGFVWAAASCLLTVIISGGSSTLILKILAEDSDEE